MDRTWTIGELAEHAAAALAVDGSAQVSGRVRDLPNERLIRWYTTIGLVDPPLGRRGRTSLYGPRHLLQLVAVKRRQAAGRSIAEIQLELAGATDATLAQIADLPATPAPAASATPAGSVDPVFSTGHHRGRTQAAETADALVPAKERGATPGAETGEVPESLAPARPNGGERGPGSSGGDEGSARESFWKARPDVSYSEATVADDYRATRHTVVQGVRLVPGLTVLLDGPALSGDDLAAIETAARPLLDELRKRGLLSEDPAEDPAESPIGNPGGIPAGGSTQTPAFLPAAQSRRPQ
jgi:DNA-binding transcriptional MerR regulator